MVKINELKPYMKKVDIEGKIIGKNEVREVTSKLDNSSHKVTEVTIGDDSGCVLLTLWDDAIEQVEEGKSYKVTNGYTSTFKDSLRMNVGRYGELSDGGEIANVNSENNISEKEITG